MTIKQTGGIFGRNPTFNDVDVQDLTAATGAVSGNLTANALGVGTTAIEGRAIVEGSGVDLRLYNSDATANGSHTALIRAYKSTGFWNDVRVSGSNVIFDTFTGERARITNDGLTFNGDTAAANALDDYEEGTFTPTWTGLTTSGTETTNAGFYTKVGRMVHYSTFLQYSTSFDTTQGTTHHTLPFAAFKSGANFASNESNAVNVYTGTGLIFSGTSLSYVPTVSAGNTMIVFSGTYMAV